MRYLDVATQYVFNLYLMIAKAAQDSKHIYICISLQTIMNGFNINPVSIEVQEETSFMSQ